MEEKDLGALGPSDCGPVDQPGTGGWPLHSGKGHGQVQEPHHTQPVLKWYRNVIKKPRSQRYDSLKGVGPRFLRNMHFAKKHNKKGLKKMQPNNAKAISTCAEVIKILIKPKEVKPKIPKRCQLQARSTCLHCPLQAWEACSCPHCQGA
ncbi:hypothetical protein H8959_021035 [Pygathrix nigripes]